MLRTRLRVAPLTALILSSVFAALLTGVGIFELFSPSFAAEYGRPAPVTLRVPFGGRIVHRDGQLQSLSYTYRRIIIPRGTTLLPSKEDHRAAVQQDQLRRKAGPLHLLSTFVLYLFGCLVITTYFQRFGHSRTRLLRSQIGMLTLVLLTVLAARALLLMSGLSAFWIPLAALSLWVAVSFDRRTGLLVDMFTCFVLSSLLRFDVVLLAVFVVRGLGATLFLFSEKRSRHMIPAGVFAGLASAVAYCALMVLLRGDAVFIVADLGRGMSSHLIACVAGGLVAGVLGTLLREPAQFVMGHVSRTRLLDLTDIEAPLLRKMATEAPGSWEHSRAMANLAEAAAASISADSLLTRVGAYYHDLGKTVQPKYFIENLTAGEASPHGELSAAVSADAIMAHVVLGTKILRQGGVPEPVVEFAYTHHGTQVVEFFWEKYQQEEHDEDEVVLQRSHFSYPGMKPMSKETAILMLVDSIEAASRTVSPASQEKFEEMIRRVVFTKLGSGQLDDSGLTVSDLRTMTTRMASTLVNMYHGRIKYPWQRREEAEAKAEAKVTSEEAADATAVDPESSASGPQVEADTQKDTVQGDRSEATTEEKDEENES